MHAFSAFFSIKTVSRMILQKLWLNVSCCYYNTWGIQISSFFYPNCSLFISSHKTASVSNKSTLFCHLNSSPPTAWSYRRDQSLLVTNPARPPVDVVLSFYRKAPIPDKFSRYSAHDTVRMIEISIQECTKIEMGYTGEKAQITYLMDPSMLYSPIFMSLELIYINAVLCFCHVDKPII